MPDPRQVRAQPEVRPVNPPRSVLLTVDSGTWSGLVHYWLRIDRRWFAYAVWSEGREQRRQAVFAADQLRPMDPRPVQVRRALGWAPGTLVALRRRRGREWEARVTVYAGRRNRSVGTDWYPIVHVRLGPPADPSSGPPADLPPYRGR